MILAAEYVSNGHPDRLCDQIVNDIVTYVVSQDKDALCGLECAVHTNKVFVDGRIAAGKDEPVIDKEKIKDIVRDVYDRSGYHDRWFGNFKPHAWELEIILDVCIELLSDEERDLRSYSDDQNVVNGYAINNEETNYLPVEHYVAISVGNKYQNMKNIYHGPDFKILVQLNKEGNQYNWERLTVSVQHSQKVRYQDLYDSVKRDIDNILKELFDCTSLTSLSAIDEERFFLNGAGDFIQGGPEGDNGLSGKKLCIDFYGPNVPIGGGAIYGKDPHKVDVCGAFRARQLALKLVKEHGFTSVFTTLAWSPGEKAPYIIQAYEIDEFGAKFPIDKSLLPPKDFFSIDCINNDLNLDERKVVSVLDIR